MTSEVDRISEGVFYRPPDHTSLTFADPSLHGALNHPDICWRENRPEHRQARRFLECTDENFLTQMIKEKKEGEALLDLTQTRDN